MKRITTIVSILTALAVGGMMLANKGFAEDTWQKNHPRRTEVNQRQRREQRRIDQGIKHGQLSPGEAAQLEKEQTSIHDQQMQDAAAHGGHITKQEQRQINREENAESHQIYQDRHN